MDGLHMTGRQKLRLCKEGLQARWCWKTAFIRHLKTALKAQNIINLYACIGYPEEDDEYLTKNSKQFHEHLGYRLIGEFRKCGYKFGRWYHMVWMEKMIGEHPEKPEQVKRFSEI